MPASGERAMLKFAASYAAIIVAIVILCRYVGASVAAVVVVVGCSAALSNKIALALSAFILLPFITIFNPTILPLSGMFWGLCLRGGPLLIGLCLVVAGQRRKGSAILPLGALGAYLAIAAICSTQGYVPKISYMKLLNFFFFFWVIWHGTQNLNKVPQELFKVRAFLLGLIAFLTVGSLVLRRFPSISTMSGLKLMQDYQLADAEAVEEFLNMSVHGQLFVGILNHSQALAGVASCCFAWVVCDMLFVEKHFSKLHLALIAIIPMLVFLTRSRTGLMVIAAFMVILYFYTLQRINLPPKLKGRIRNACSSLLFVGIVVCIVGEARSGLITRWLRKTDNIAGDTRDLTTAVTETRQGLIARNMRDFNRNRLLGSGFQVDLVHVERYAGKSGIIITAPIEKGILPLMVLGETGILGALFFIFFLYDFCMRCIQMKLWSTLTLFWVLFICNMSEATFFAPGGSGGIEWCITIIGGFVCDSYIQSMQNGRPIPWKFLRRLRQTIG